MAEFLNDLSPESNPIIENSFNNMGKPIPVFRREAAYTFCKSIGLPKDKASTCVSSMIFQLEKDEPYQAMAAGMRYVDLTGTYRLIAILLVEPDPDTVDERYEYITYMYPTLK